MCARGKAKGRNIAFKALHENRDGLADLQFGCQ